jgi:hypothetical protein
MALGNMAITSAPILTIRAGSGTGPVRLQQSSPILDPSKGLAMAGCTPGAASTITPLMAERDFIVWREVQIKFLGRTIVGSYALSRDGLVTVKTSTGEKATQLGGSPAEFIAKRLLRELAVEGNA